MAGVQVQRRNGTIVTINSADRRDFIGSPTEGGTVSQRREWPCQADQAPFMSRRRRSAAAGSLCNAGIVDVGLLAAGPRDSRDQALVPRLNVSLTAGIDPRRSLWHLRHTLRSASIR